MAPAVYRSNYGILERYGLAGADPPAALPGPGARGRPIRGPTEASPFPGRKGVVARFPCRRNRRDGVWLSVVAAHHRPAAQLEPGRLAVDRHGHEREAGDDFRLSWLPHACLAAGGHWSGSRQGWLHPRWIVPIRPSAPVQSRDAAGALGSRGFPWPTRARVESICPQRLPNNRDTAGDVESS